jgi:hypothetical protein
MKPVALQGFVAGRLLAVLRQQIRLAQPGHPGTEMSNSKERQGLQEGKWLPE